jgi:hypothetical protein
MHVRIRPLEQRSSAHLHLSWKWNERVVGLELSNRQDHARPPSDVRRGSHAINGKPMTGWRRVSISARAPGIMTTVRSPRGSRAESANRLSEAANSGEASSARRDELLGCGCDHAVVGQQRALRRIPVTRFLHPRAPHAEKRGRVRLAASVAQRFGDRAVGCHSPKVSDE